MVYNADYEIKVAADITYSTFRQTADTEMQIRSCQISELQKS
jgi:hypothetical protein